MTTTKTATGREAAIARLLARPYARVLEREAGGCYAARILEFPDVASDGDTPDAAIAALDEALAGTLDVMLEHGDAIPEPLALTEYSGRVTLRMPPALHRDAATLAAAQGVGLNRLLCEAIARYVGGQGTGAGRGRERR